VGHDMLSPVCFWRRTAPNRLSEQNVSRNVIG
jgi:hypothetical protein